MKWRTTTRPNGQKDHRETVLGWDVWLPRLVSAIAVVGAVWGVADWCSSVKHDIAIDRAERAQADKDLPDKIAAAIAAASKTDGYVSRNEWLTDKQAQDEVIHQVARDLAHATTQLYRTNHLLEQQPAMAKEPR